jgi:hypothetical protein
MEKFDRWEFLLQKWGYENGPAPGSYWWKVERVLKKRRKQKQKSIEDIKLELNEKFDQIEKNYKEKCILSKARADREFERFCKQQNQDFEIAKTNGRFPQKINFVAGITNAVVLSSGSCATWSIANNVNLNKTNISKGYWLIKPNLKIYSEKNNNNNSV